MLTDSPEKFSQFPQIFHHSQHIYIFPVNSAQLFLLTTSPAFEKLLSAGTEEASIPRYLTAHLPRAGKVCSSCCHQSRGSLSRGISISLEYQCTSMSTLAAADW